MTDQTSSPPSKFCIQCKHYRGTRWQHSLDDTHGNCTYRAMVHLKSSSQCTKDIASSYLHPVTGQKVFHFTHDDALAVRKDEAACGMAAVWFEEYVREAQSPLLERAERHRASDKRDVNAMLEELENLA